MSGGPFRLLWPELWNTLPYLRTKRHDTGAAHTDSYMDVVKHQMQKAEQCSPLPTLPFVEKVGKSEHKGGLWERSCWLQAHFAPVCRQGENYA